MSKQPTAKACSKCLKSKNIINDYYLASNDTLSVDGRLSICKPCMASLIDMDRVETLIDVMRAVDRPFLWDTYNGALEKKNSFGEYMRMLVTPQNRDKTYLDSIFNKELSNYSNNDELRSFNEDVIVGEDGYSKDDNEILRKRWGEFSPEDYEFLEDYYREYAHTYDTDTPVQVMLYRNIAKVHLQAGKELSKGSAKSYKDLMDLSSKMHKDGNINPIQNSGANADLGVSTYGLWIKEIENEEPCEYFEERESYEDYDSFNKYWEKWFIRPFKNIFGVSNDFDVKDDEDGRL